MLTSRYRPYDEEAWGPPLTRVVSYQELRFHKCCEHIFGQCAFDRFVLNRLADTEKLKENAMHRIQLLHSMSQRLDRRESHGTRLNMEGETEVQQ